MSGTDVISDVTAQAHQREQAALNQYVDLVLALLAQNPPAADEVARILDAANKSAADLEHDLAAAEERHKLIGLVALKPEADAKTQQANHARRKFTEWKHAQEAAIDERDSEVMQIESQAASLRNRAVGAEIKLSKQVRSQREAIYNLLRQLATAGDDEKQQILDELKTLQVRDLIAG